MEFFGTANVVEFRVFPSLFSAANDHLLRLLFPPPPAAAAFLLQAAQRKKVAEAAAAAAASGAADGLSELKLSAEAGAAAEMAAATAAPVYGDAASASVRTSTGLLTSEPRSRDVKISSFSLSLYGHVLVRLAAVAARAAGACSASPRAAAHAATRCAPPQCFHSFCSPRARPGAPCRSRTRRLS